MLSAEVITSSKICIILILGDPGAVSRVGIKGATKVFKYGRKSPWVPTLTELFPKIQADAGSWLGKKCSVLLCPIGEQFLLSSFREFVHDGYCLATLALFVHQACASKGNFLLLLLLLYLTWEKHLAKAILQVFQKSILRKKERKYVHRSVKIYTFYFPNQKRRNYRWIEKTFGMLSAGAIQFAPRIFCFWLITMYRK